jgi:hypothetical protein
MSPWTRTALIACSLCLSACLFTENPSGTTADTGGGGEDTGAPDAGEVDSGEPDSGCTIVDLDHGVLCGEAGAECGTITYQGACGEVEIDCDAAGLGCLETDVCNAENECECAPPPTRPPEELCDELEAQCGEVATNDACGDPFVVACGECSLGAYCDENACARDQIFSVDPEANASFGFAVSLEPGKVAVGKPSLLNFLGSGTVELFERTAERWAHTSTFRPVNEDNRADAVLYNALFGTEVLLSGENLFVGAPGRREGPLTANRTAVGGVYHFVFGGNSWGIAQVILPPDPEGEAAQGSTCGSAIARDGDTLYVGCPGGYFGQDREYTPNQRGRVEIYRRASVTERFEHVETLFAPGSLEDDYDMFGMALGVTNEGLLVGAPTASNPAKERTGAAYYFRKGADGLMLARTLTPNALTANAAFGFSLDTAQNGAVIGAPSFDLTGDDVPDQRGAAFVILDLDTDPGLARFVAPEGEEGVGDGFGYSVAIRGFKLLIGAPYYRGLGAAFGRRYGANGDDEVTEIQPPMPRADNLTGFAVDVSLDGGVVASPGMTQQTGDGALERAGGVLAFPWSSPEP